MLNISFPLDLQPYLDISETFVFISLVIISSMLWLTEFFGLKEKLKLSVEYISSISVDYELLAWKCFSLWHLTYKRNHCQWFWTNLILMSTTVLASKGTNNRIAYSFLGLGFILVVHVYHLIMFSSCFCVDYILCSR